MVIAKLDEAFGRYFDGITAENLKLQIFSGAGLRPQFAPAEQRGDQMEGSSSHLPTCFARRHDHAREHVAQGRGPGGAEPAARGQTRLCRPLPRGGDTARPAQLSTGAAPRWWLSALL